MMQRMTLSASSSTFNGASMGSTKAPAAAVMRTPLQVWKNSLKFSP